MEIYSCPKGHSSTEADFCSECGAKIQGLPAAAAPKPAPAVASNAVLDGQPKPQLETCKDCGTPRFGDGNFCEICGYNFVTGAHGEIPVQTPPSPPAPVVTSPPEISAVQAPAAPEQGTCGWSLSVQVDPSLREPESPSPPADVSPFAIVLDKPVSLIGRKSSTRAIFPEISLDFDDAVSHRHALLERGADGTLRIRDIGAANGTRLNGKNIKPMTDEPLQDGDQITLGRWTRITVKATH